MASKCFMCGREVSSGILCEKCDKPRKPKVNAAAAAPPATPQPPVESAPKRITEPHATAAPAPSDPPRPVAEPARTESAGGRRPSSPGMPAVNLATASVPQRDPFPKAPILPFPVESASPAITSIVNLLVTAGVASVLLGPDRTVKFVSDEAKRLFDAAASDINLKFIETKTGLHIGNLSAPTSAGVRLGDVNILYSLVPISGGASGAVMVFRPAYGYESHPSFGLYVRETIIGPLRTLHESLLTATKTPPSEAFLEDAAATIDHVLSSLELAPGVEESGSEARPLPTVSDVVRRVGERYVPFADLKGIHLQVDVPDLEERFLDHDQLGESLAILMDNALHYVPASGQVVLGCRWMEHKGKPLLLFFVMDNGPIVPEQLRQQIFEPNFVWQPSAAERTGRGLFKCREFALAHNGSVWVESKTGKACTFFLRVRPDGTA
jgi:hypothetical protein